MSHNGSKRDERTEWAESIATTKALVAAEATAVFSSFFNKWVRVLRVGKAITSDYRTISDALAHSKPQDRIEIEVGTYYETIAIGHSIELTTSDNGDDAVITTRGPCITISTDQPVMISRLAVTGRGQRPSDCVAILISRGSPVIEDCILSAVHVAGVATPTITHCTIENSEGGCGLRLTDHCGGEYTLNDIRFHRCECVKIACSGRPVFRKNRIYQKNANVTVVNIAGGRYGADCAPILDENLISGTEHFTNAGGAEMHSGGTLFDRPLQLLNRNLSVPDGLVAVSWGASPVLRNNTLLAGAVGVHLEDCLMPEGHFENNRILACSAWGMYLAAAAVAHINDNELTGNAGGIRTHANDAVILNCRLHQNAYFGIMAFRSSTTIVKNTIDRSEVGLVVLHNCSDMRFEENVVRQTIVAAAHVIAAGTCTLEKNIFVSNRGVGVLVSDGSSMTLSHCNCKENDTNIMIRGQSRILAHHNQLFQPTSHNVVFMEASGGVLEHNDISESPTLAHVAVVQKSNPTIRNNFIRAGASSGILVESRATPLITNNQISSLREAIRVRLKGDPIVTNNELSSCADGLVCEENGTCLFTNNTLRAMGNTFVTTKSGGHPSFRDNDCRNSARVGFCIEDGGRGDFEKNVVRDSSLCGCLVSGPISFANVRGNRFLGAGGGVSVERLAKAVVIKNTFSDMKRYGLRVTQQAAPVMSHNAIYSSEGIGILGLDGGGSISDNIVQGCASAGIHVADGCFTAFSRNMVCDNVRDGIIISKGARSRLEGEICERNGGCGVVVEGDATATDLKGISIWKNQGHGVKVLQGGSCVLEACTISENQGDGIYLMEAGDVVFTECNISLHRRCVVCRDEGVALIERCTIFDASGDAAVYVMQNGQLKLTHSIIESCASNGVRVAFRGHANVTDCTIRNCKAAGVEVCADAVVTMAQSEVLACDVGVNFVGMTSEAELKETTIEKVLQVRRGSRRRSSSASVTPSAESSPPVSTPLSPLTLSAEGSSNEFDGSGQQDDGGLSKSRRIGLPHVAVMVSSDEESAPAPEKPLDRTRIQHCKIIANRIGVQCPTEGTGCVEDATLEENVMGVLLCAETNVAFERIQCLMSTHYGLVVDGTPGSLCAVRKSRFMKARGCGGIVRNSVSPDFVLEECEFEANNGGGLVLLGSRIVVRKSRITQHDTFGAWHAAGDHSTVDASFLDANKENNVVVLGGSCPLYTSSTIRNSEHGIAVLQTMSSFVLTECSVILNRIGIALYDEAAGLDKREAIQDSDWNDRYRGGGSRRRSSVAAILAHLGNAGDVVAAAVKQATPVASQTADVNPYAKKRSLRRKESSTSQPQQRAKSVSIATGSDAGCRQGTAKSAAFLLPAALVPNFNLGSLTPSMPGPATPGLSQEPQRSVARVEKCEMDQNSIGVDHASRSCDLEVHDTRFINCLTNGCLVQRQACLRMNQCFVSGSTSGIVLRSDSKATIHASALQNNRTGVFVDGNANAAITQCTIVENSQAGISACDKVVLTTVSECKFGKNGRGGGVQVSGSSIMLIDQCEFSDEPFAIRVDERSSPRLLTNTFKDCLIGIDVSGARCCPKICFNNFVGGHVGVNIDEHCTPVVYRNVFQQLEVAGIEIRHFADPTIVQNIFEECLTKGATGIVIESNGAGVIGNNRFSNNYNGIRAGCNTESCVTMLNSFEKHSNAAAVFLEAACGHFSRNQCSLNGKSDVLVLGGPAMAGLVIDRNAFVVSGTGVALEGSATNAAVVRQNRFFGSGGTGVSLGVQCNAVVTECLFHALHTGVVFAEGSSGVCDTSLIVGCGVGVKACSASEGTVKDATIISSTTHSLQTTEGSKLLVTGCRLGQNFGSVSSLLLAGAGEVNNSLLIASLSAIVTCTAGCSATIQRNIIQQGKCGVQFSADCNPVIRTNIITRNDLGVNISTNAGGVLNANSCFSNAKGAIQVNAPHKVMIGKNFFAQDNDTNPSVLGVSGQELAALAKANNAVGHGGRAEGGEKFIVPVTVSKAVAAETVLLNQFHHFLTAVGAPPTDALSAAIDTAILDMVASLDSAGDAQGGASPGGQGAAAQGGGSGYHYGQLVTSAASKPTHAWVIAAQERILDVMQMVSDDEVIKQVMESVAAMSTRKSGASAVGQKMGNHAALKRLQQVNWDLKRPLVSSKKSKARTDAFVWDRYENYSDDDASQSSSSGTSVAYTSGSDSDWDYERMPDGSKRKRRRKGGWGTAAQSTPGSKSKQRRRTTKSEKGLTTKSGQKGRKSQPFDSAPPSTSLEAQLLDAQQSGGGVTALSGGPPPLDLETGRVPDEPPSTELPSTMLPPSAEGMKRQSALEGSALGVDTLEPTREPTVANPDDADVIHGAQPPAPAVASTFIDISQLQDHQVGSRSTGRKSTNRALSRSPSQSKIRGKSPAATKPPPSPEKRRSPVKSKSMRKEPSFMRPVSKEPRQPVTIPEEPILGKHRSTFRLRPSPPPSTVPTMTDEERAEDAAKRLQAYEAVWFVMKTREMRSRSVAATHVAALAAAAQASPVRGVDPNTMSRTRRARSLPGGRAWDQLWDTVDGSGGSSAALDLIVTDERGCPLSLMNLIRGGTSASGAGAADTDIDGIRGIVLVARDDEHEKCRRDTVLWLAEGNFPPIGEPLEVVRAMVLRRLQLAALATDQPRMADVAISLFEQIAGRGSRIVVDHDRASWEEANRKRAEAEADIMHLLATPELHRSYLRPCAPNSSDPKTPLSPNTLRVVGKAGTSKSPMTVFEGILDDPASHYPAEDLAADSNVAKDWLDKEVRRVARRTEQEWLKSVDDKRMNILKLVGPAIPQPVVVSTLVDTEAGLPRPMDSELQSAGAAQRQQWRNGFGDVPASASSTSSRRVPGPSALTIALVTPKRPLVLSAEPVAPTPPPLTLNEAFHVQLPRLTAARAHVVAAAPPAALPQTGWISPRSGSRGSPPVIVSSVPPQQSPVVSRQFHTTRMRATPQLVIGSRAVTPRDTVSGSSHGVTPRVPSSALGRTSSSTLHPPIPLPLHFGASQTLSAELIAVAGSTSPLPPPFDASRPRETSPFYMRIDPIEPLPLLNPDDDDAPQPHALLSSGIVAAA